MEERKYSEPIFTHDSKEEVVAKLYSLVSKAKMNILDDLILKRNDILYKDYRAYRTEIAARDTTSSNASK